ncbi:GGDEF domain-containing protein [Noviherbaspirillum galbum]|uniref:diguanylate cyclase n=1 Tax=Noviherbaspirillum galbum TaxID=2709383 RepID=A0A6B3SZ50_9BURK|nr:GGDEF domain-containing protein [Noviherbaspirillum galbum]NEX64342.1 diguanylate cyclase [Noviherbaspirillum galbum]
MLLDNAREPLRSTSRPEALNRRRHAKLSRAPQIAPVSVVLSLYSLSLFIFHQLGYLATTTLAAACGTAIFLVAGFYAAFRLTLHTRFTDPTMTSPQIIAVVLLMLVVAYLERATQPALVPFILIAFSFGMFRQSTRMLILHAAGCLLCYLGIILVRGQKEQYGAAFEADLLQWFVLSLSLPGMILLGKQVQNLRQLLSATRYQLEHYEEKSVRDDLTGLYNRRHIKSELEQARLQANAENVPFCLCVIDIDRFKEINDNNGHLAGDTILKEFSKVASNSIRDSDMLGRYGGDEFLLLLKNTDLKGAVMHAERLRVYAHFLDFQKVLTQKHISLSIGVAQYRPGEKIEDLMSRADSALYQAKQLGRNRVEWLES